MLDCLTYAGNRSTLEGATNVELFVGEVRDTELFEHLLREHIATTMMHLAAESHIDRSISGPDGIIDTNILGTNSPFKRGGQCLAARRGGRAPLLPHFNWRGVGPLAPYDPAFGEITPCALTSPYSGAGLLRNLRP